MDELETLYPVPTSIRIADVVIELSPLRLGELPAVAKALRGVSIPLSDAAGESVKLGDIDVMALLAGDSAGSVLTALTLAARVERAWLDALELDEALELAFAVIEVNADFFTRRVLPLLTTQMEKLAARVGSTLSSASSLTDMPRTA